MYLGLCDNGISITDIARVVEGTLYSKNPEDIAFGVSIDSRTISEGDIFFAIKGEKFDGHDFIEQAAAVAGDVPLAVQRDIFSVLDCPRQIGLSLNDSLLMSPSKSVTAFVGLSDGGDGPAGGKCGACGKKDCAFRGAL